MKKFMGRGKSRTIQSLAGLSAKRNGQSAEDIVEATSDYYKAQGLAELLKRYEPYKRVSSGSASTFRGVYAGKSGPDYEIWLYNGKGGHLEVKSREADRIPISAIDEEQARMLSLRMAWGQLAYVLVRLRGTWFLVSWYRWRLDENGVVYKRKSHNAIQLEQIGRKIPVINGRLELPIDEL